MAYEIHKRVLFRTNAATKMVTLDDLVARSSASGAFGARVSGLFVYVRELADENDPSAPAVRLSIAQGPDVHADALAIAELHAQRRADRALIAACDASIEVAWKPDDWDDVVDVVLALEPELEDQVGGVTWFVNVKELSDGSFPST